MNTGPYDSPADFELTYPSAIPVLSFQHKTSSKVQWKFYFYGDDIIQLFYLSQAKEYSSRKISLKDVVNIIIPVGLSDWKSHEFKWAIT